MPPNLSPLTIDPLVENLTVRQRETEGFRRWFVSSYFELILWYEQKGGPLSGFQLCVSRNRWERAFTWTKDYVSSHFVSDSFVENGMPKMSTGILHGTGRRISQEELTRFDQESAALDPKTKALIMEKIVAHQKEGH